MSQSSTTAAQAPPLDSLARLEQIVTQRLQAGDASTSYVAQVAAQGRAHIARKCGEEAVETIVAALGEDKQAVTAEVSDLLFHLTILLAERGLSWNDIARELEQRHGTSGLVEKAARSSTSKAS